MVTCQSPGYTDVLNYSTGSDSSTQTYFPVRPRPDWISSAIQRTCQVHVMGNSSPTGCVRACIAVHIYMYKCVCVGGWVGGWGCAYVGVCTHVVPGTDLPHAPQVSVTRDHHTILPLKRLHVEGSAVGIRHSFLKRQNIK